MTLLALLGLSPAAVSAAPGSLALMVPSLFGTPGMVQGLALVAASLG